MHVLVKNAFKVNDLLVNIDLMVEKGSLNFLVGENGVGKTSLFTYLKIHRELLQGSKVVFVDQEKLRPLADLSVKEVLALILEEVPGSKNLKECPFCERLQIKSLMDKKVSSLSGGENQKLKIALALLMPFDILFMDEPLQSLDEQSQKKVISILEDLSKDKIVLIIEHDTAKYNRSIGRKNVMKRTTGSVEVTHGRT
ncbi:MAG: hypothetical protein CME64_17770 [Halobacteriovoraceae bacterium]|nr:hypothetical protein [Halobacteriovoraceae bacterium]|tara:strand:+ start:25182 stop:25775 length:594 start_codon:yes stop_codon:yes gene_type:complete